VNCCCPNPAITTHSNYFSTTSPNNEEHGPGTRNRAPEYIRIMFYARRYSHALLDIDIWKVVFQDEDLQKSKHF